MTPPIHIRSDCGHIWSLGSAGGRNQAYSVTVVLEIGAFITGGSGAATQVAGGLIAGFVLKKFKVKLKGSKHINVLHIENSTSLFVYETKKKVTLNGYGFILMS